MNLHEYLKEHLSVPVIAALGAHLNLPATQSARIAEEVLPGQLGALSTLSRTPAGARKLLDLTCDRIPAGSVKTLTGNPKALALLQHVGAHLLPEVMGAEVNTEARRLASTTDTDAQSVRRMMELLLPLLLSAIGQRATSGNLTTATLTTLFGGAALTGIAAAPVAVLSSRPDVEAKRTPLAPAPLKPVIRPVQEERRRRIPVWWWPLPLVLVMGVSSCYLAQRNQVELTSRQPAGEVGVNTSVTLGGTGKSGQTVMASEKGASLSTAQVGQAGAFSATVPAPAAGPHIYTVAQSIDAQYGR